MRMPQNDHHPPRIRNRSGRHQAGAAVGGAPRAGQAPTGGAAVRAFTDWPAAALRVTAAQLTWIRFHVSLSK
jgi:hypothetical protein